MKSFIRYVAVAALALACLPALAAATQDKFADLGGVRIRYIDEGKGEPVVLLHGGGSQLETWISSGVDLDHTLKATQRLKQLRPDVTLVTVEGASHTGSRGIQRHPQLVSAIREFIARQGAQ